MVLFVSVLFFLAFNFFRGCENISTSSFNSMSWKHICSFRGFVVLLCFVVLHSRSPMQLGFDCESTSSPLSDSVSRDISIMGSGSTICVQIKTPQARACQWQRLFLQPLLSRVPQDLQSGLVSMQESKCCDKILITQGMRGPEGSLLFKVHSNIQNSVQSNCQVRQNGIN